MQRLRLSGLVLFITAIFLSLAAAATRTTYIRIYQPWSTTSSVDEMSPAEALEAVDPDSPEVKFVTVPIVWPLATIAAAGLMLWFVQVPQATKPVRRRKRRRRKRGRRR